MKDDDAWCMMHDHDHDNDNDNENDACHDAW